MPFSDVPFWVSFAAFVCLYWCMAREVRARNWLLLAASYGLYWWWDGRFLAVLLLATAVSYGAAFMVQPGKRYRTQALWACILLGVGMLGYFKYAGFFLENLTVLAGRLGMRMDAPTLQLILPLGISFYVFQVLAYLIEVYRGTLPPERDPVAYALLVAFFPKIASGPIEPPGPLLKQFHEHRRFTASLFSDGCFLIVWGAVLKFAIADNAAIIAGKLFGPVPAVALLTGALAVTLQIYADFAGYSNIAKGIAALLGFELSWNFRIPYASRSPSEFWTRWHITLSRWFRHYVYFPLGGSRRGAMRTALNLLVTMTLVGLWHGPRWTYVLWGAYHGLLLIAYRAGERLLPPGSALIRFLNETWLSAVFFFLFTMAGWVLFQSPTAAGALRAFTAVQLFRADLLLWLTLALWLPVVLMEAFQTERGDLLAPARLPLRYQLPFYFAAWYLLLYLPPLTPQAFIYVQF